jgi:predicted DNA-binding protein with PD1-like motif
MHKFIPFLLLLISMSTSAQPSSVTPKIYVIRLHPGDDLKIKLSEFVKEKKIKAGYIITCVGSLSRATLRLANRNETETWKESFEIISLAGTLSPDGNHLHISIANKEGVTIGGHLMDGSIISTTAELVIGEAPDLSFTRETDSTTTFKELKVYPK